MKIVTNGVCVQASEAHAGCDGAEVIFSVGWCVTRAQLVGTGARVLTQARSRLAPVACVQSQSGLVNCAAHIHSHSLTPGDCYSLDPHHISNLTFCVS